MRRWAELLETGEDGEVGGPLLSWGCPMINHSQPPHTTRSAPPEERPLEPAAGSAAAGNDPIIRVNGLVKRYGEIEAVAGIDFDVRRNIGLVFQDTTLDGYLTAERNLRFHAELYGVPRSVVGDRLRQVLEMVGLWDRRGSLVQTFSGGMMRRLEIARGLLHSPRVLFLDEPTAGLDPQTRSSIWGYIEEPKRTEDVTVFVTTHYMDEAEYADRIAIIDHGSIVVVDTPEARKASVGKDRVQIRTEDDRAAIAALAQRFGIEAAVHEGAVTFSVPAGEQFVPRLFAELGVPIRSVNVARPTFTDR